MKDISQLARLYILSVILFGAVIAGRALTSLQRPGLSFFILIGLAVLAFVLQMRNGGDRVAYNLCWLVYGFSLLHLGAAPALAVILIIHLVEGLWHNYRWYVQSYKMAAYAVSISASGYLLTWIRSGQELFSFESVLATLAALVTFTVGQYLAIWMLHRVAPEKNAIEVRALKLKSMLVDFSLLAFGAVEAMVWRIHPAIALLNTVPLYLVYGIFKLPILQRKADIDPKTELFNVGYFDRAIKEELARAVRLNQPLAVVLGDLDHLRSINNTYGHLAGDRVLVGVSRILEDKLPEKAVLARFGGEEFAVLLPGCELEIAQRLMEDVRESIDQAAFEVSTSVTPIRVTISFGIAGLDAISSTPNDLIHNADVALYQAKQGGRNRVGVYSDTPADELFGKSLHGPAFETRRSKTTPRGRPIGPAGEPDTRRPSSRRPTVPNQAIPRVRKPSPAWVLYAFIVGVTALGLASLVLLFDPAMEVDWFGLGVFQMVLILTGWLSLEVYVRNSSISTAGAALIAGAVLLGPVGAVILGLTYAVTVSIKRRTPPRRLIFNAGKNFIDGALCIGIIYAIRASYLEMSVVIQISFVLLAAILMFLAESMLITIAVGLSSGESVRHIWKENFGWRWPYYLALGAGAYALILGYTYASLIGVAVVLAPLLVVRFGQMQYISHTRGMVERLRKKNLELEEQAFELEKHSHEISTLNEELLLVLASVIDLRDPYVYGHSENVARYAVLIAERLGLSAERLESVRKAGLLHDIGKLGIPEEILFKPAALTDAEYEIIKAHPDLGAQILLKCHSLRPLSPVIRHHHERYDGRGYPEGLQRQEIPLEARVISLADALEAMASDRPYRRALTYQEIMDEIRSNAGTQFDPNVVSAFLEVMQEKGEGVIVNSARDLETREPALLNMRSQT